MLPDKRNKIYYLASPLSDPDPAIEYSRYKDQQEAAADIEALGYTLLLPIEMSYQIAMIYKQSRTSYENYRASDRLFLSRCDGLFVLMLTGWRSSIGVTDEIHYAKELGLPVYYVEPQTYYITEESPDGIRVTVTAR